MPFISLTTPTKDLFMIGKTYARRLKKLGIETTEDLIHHYPFRYEDYRLVSKIARIQMGETVTVQGEIISFDNIYTKYGKRVQKMIVGDGSGQTQVIFFNQPFLKKSLKPGLSISLSGKVGTFNHQLSFISPEYEMIKLSHNIKNGNQFLYNTEKSIEEKCTKSSILRSIVVNVPYPRTIHTGCLVPVYPETYGVSSKWLRSRITPLLTNILPKLPDWLPEEIKRYNKLTNLPHALGQIHFPEDKIQIRQARARLAFDELFLMQTQTLLRKKAWQKNKITLPLKINQQKVQEFISQLPFKLTDDQSQVINQILADLKKPTPMNRLLQGEVGCGKTVVAAVAAYVCYLNGAQTAVMAPTEILALQHWETFKSLLEPFGIKIGLTTGSKKLAISNWSLAVSKKDKKQLKTNDQRLKTDILIGTHALLYNKVNFQSLGLVIIDEQHRFGVEQRARLIRKGKAPHTLIMTATPIPRTVALTLYGDLDLSVIIKMPKGRLKTKTWVVPPEKRIAAYNWIKKQIQQGESQAFIVCPLIEPSQVESMKNIKAAKEEFAKLSKEIFPDLRLGLLHGRLKAKEKEKVINNFREKKLDILVATPVVEVGIDIPQATIIMIEGADRFGLATLHQLRGRVGRREKQAYCLLFSSQKGKAYKRLKLMETCNNGMELAEKDLRFRGPGELYGAAQHGFIKLKIASFSDLELVEKTRRAAEYLMKKTNYKLFLYPALKEKIKTYTIRAIEPN